MTHFKNKLKPNVPTETRSNTCMTQTGSMYPVTGAKNCAMETESVHPVNRKLYNENMDWYLNSMEIGTLWPRCN